MTSRCACFLLTLSWPVSQLRQLIAVSLSAVERWIQVVERFFRSLRRRTTGLENPTNIVISVTIMTGLRDTSVNELASVIDSACVRTFYLCSRQTVNGDSRSCRPDWPAADYVLIAKGKLVNRYGDFGLARRSLQVIICYCQLSISLYSAHQEKRRRWDWRE